MTGTDLIRPSKLNTYLSLGVVSPDLAEDDYDKERERWKKGGTVKDQAVVHALTAHEGNRQLVDLHAVIVKGGRQKDPSLSSFLPSLAVAPVTATAVNMKISHDGELVYWTGLGKARRFARWAMRMDAQRTWAVGKYEDPSSYTRVATIPPLPPDVRGIAHKKHLILWEATWRRSAKKAAAAPASVDPALLEHISGTLYIVRATWELSSLEAAALA